MFIMELSPAYFAPVKVSLLDADGNLKEHEFDMQFVRMTQLEIDEFVAQETVSALDAVKRVVRNWRHVMDAQGLAVPFSEDNLAKLLTIPGVAASILKAFIQSWSPVEGVKGATSEEAAQKN